MRESPICVRETMCERGKGGREVMLISRPLLPGRGVIEVARESDLRISDSLGHSLSHNSDHTSLALGQSHLISRPLLPLSPGIGLDRSHEKVREAVCERVQNLLISQTLSQNRPLSHLRLSDRSVLYNQITLDSLTDLSYPIREHGLPRTRPLSQISLKI